LRFSRSVFALSIFCILLGCSGGSGTSTTNNNSSACSYQGDTYSGCYPARQTSSSYETDEYQYSYGVGSLNSSVAYSRELSGDGVKIGIFDTGVNPNHSEFSGKTFSGYNYQDSNTIIQDQNGHGTHVAGTIIANKDNTGMQGIAYGVTSIVSYQIFRDNGVFTGQSSVSDASTRSILANAKVVNHSWGTSTTNNSFSKSYLDIFHSTEITGYQNMVNNDIIQVWATGNDGYATPNLQAQLPYHYSNLKELWIAVTGIDSNGTEYSAANRCGIAADWCIAAPAVSVISTDEDHTSEYQNYSGTSMAAPHVTGAIAILIEAFPTLSAEQIVDRLFATASTSGLTDRDGNSYSSSVFGHGKIDLDAATKPIEVLALSSPSNNLNNSSNNSNNSTFHDVNNSKIIFSSAFGNKISKNNMLMKNVNLAEKFSETVVVFDTFDNAAFFVNLNSFIDISEYRDINLENLLLLNDISEKRIFLSQNIYVDFVENHNNYNDNIVSELNDNYFNNLTLNYTNERYKLSYNYSYDKEYYFLFSEKIANNMYKNNAFINPFIAMNGESHSLDYKHKIFDNVSYSLFVEKQIPYEYYTDNFNQKMSYLVSTKIKFTNNKNIFETEHGFFNEPTSFIGTVSSGAFDIEKSKTNFLGLTYTYKSKTNRILLNYFYADTKVKIDNKSMFSNFNNIKSTSWSIGLEKFLNNNYDEMISFLLYQPLRVESGSFSLYIPKYSDSLGNIFYSESQYELEADKKELNYEISYSLNKENFEYKLGTLFIYNGGHIKNNNNKIFILEVKSYL
tara:strand:- start:455 stop:2824 length:2370 start_codon:yes stop_codon:yes gene_type:complete